MSATVWVPLVTAGIGLITGLAAGLVGAILNRRWASADRVADRQREDSLRWQQDRLQVYSRLISALDAWDGVLRTAVARKKTAELISGVDAGEARPSTDWHEWDRVRGAVRDQLALVELMAPEDVRGRARTCYVAHDWLRYGFLTVEDADLAEMDAAERRADRTTRRLTDAMRADLGLGGGKLPMAGTAPRPPAARPDDPAGDHAAGGPVPPATSGG
jgi:hypothetical protein